MLAAGLARCGRLFGFLWSDVLMPSVNAGGEQRRMILQTGDAAESVWRHRDSSERPGELWRGRRVEAPFTCNS